MSQNRQNNKKNNESKEKKKKNIFKDILISIIVFIISGLLITYIYLIITGQTAIIDKIFAKVFKEEKSYSYTDYITDLNNDNVSIVDITSGSDKATVVLKSDEQKKIEKEIKEKMNQSSNRMETYKEYIKKIVIKEIQNMEFKNILDYNNISVKLNNTTALNDNISIKIPLKIKVEDMTDIEINIKNTYKIYENLNSNEEEGYKGITGIRVN